MRLIGTNLNWQTITVNKPIANEQTRRQRFSVSDANQKKNKEKKLEQKRGGG